MAIVRVPAGPVRRGRVRRRGAVGGRPRAGAGAAVAAQGREQRVLAQAFVLQLQLKVLADLFREPQVLLLQGPLQLGLELQQGGTGRLRERTFQLQDPCRSCISQHLSCTRHANHASWPSALQNPVVSRPRPHQAAFKTRQGCSPVGAPRLCAAARPAASGPASPASWTVPPPADMTEIKDSEGDGGSASGMCRSHLADERH